MYEFTGNIHIHSSYSDGALEIGEIAAIAARSGLDFIVITDHHTLKGIQDQKEGYHHGILVLVGMEANQLKNHYLCLDIQSPVGNDDKNPQQVIDAVNQQEGIGIIAHPYDPGSPLFLDGKNYPWTDWQVHDFQCMEIWNYTSQWIGGIQSLLEGISLLWFPQRAIIAPDARTMTKFDACQQQGLKIIAVGGSDAHGKKLKTGFLNIKVSPYEACFRSINVHVLSKKVFTGEYSADKELLYQSIRQGTLWVANDYYRSSHGFSFFIQAGKKRWVMGETVQAREKTSAHVLTPYPARVKLIRNGRTWKTGTGKEHTFADLDKGIYRVEAEHRHGLGFRPWIYSNSIWVQ